jgi:hypothetical protein
MNLRITILSNLAFVATLCIFMLMDHSRGPAVKSLLTVACVLVGFALFTPSCVLNKKASDLGPDHMIRLALMTLYVVLTSTGVHLILN